MQITIDNKKGFEQDSGAVRVTYGTQSAPRFTEKDEVLTLSFPATNPEDAREWVGKLRKIVREAKAHRIPRLVVQYADIAKGAPRGMKNDVLFHASVNWQMADFEFNDYKTPPKDGWQNVEEIIIANVPAPVSRTAKKSLERADIVAKEVNACRTLANTSAGEMTPESLADAAIAAMAGIPKTKVEVMGPKELKNLGAGAILGVSKGSPEEPRLIVIEYKGGRESERPLCFVGKGVTYDSGGLNIKPSSGGSMEEMHLDMSGAAAVIHATAALAKLGVKKNILCVVPAVENMVSGTSYRPGDILKSLSGKTIEVLNTDAEGRLILADALTYAQGYKPRLVVDVATLTGAALVAIGLTASIVMSRDEKLQNTLVSYGNESGDFLWPLPLWNVYKDMLKSKRADIANVPQSQGRYGGAINGGIFLSEFVNKETPWAHIDMAPRMTTAPFDNLADGAAGEPVRLLIALGEAT